MDIFVGDTVKISVPVGISVSSFTIFNILFERPDGKTGSWSAAIDPSDDTSVSYTTTSTNLSMQGIWRFQAFVSDGVTSIHGDIVEIQVFNPIGMNPPTTAHPTTHAMITTLHIHTFPPPTIHPPTSPPPTIQPTTVATLTTLHIHTFPPTTVAPTTAPPG